MTLVYTPECADCGTPDDQAVRAPDGISVCQDCVQSAVDHLMKAGELANAAGATAMTASIDTAIALLLQLQPS